MFILTTDLNLVFLLPRHFNKTLFHTQRPGLLACFMHWIIDRMFHLCKALNLFAFEIINIEHFIHKTYNYYTALTTSLKASFKY